MRLLHLSDTHCGTQKIARGGPPGFSRSDDHFRMLQLALAPALREEVDLVVHSGDVFDRSTPPSHEVARVVELFQEVARRVPMVVVAGNHDRRGLHRHMPRPPAGLSVIDEAARLRFGGLALGVVPFHGEASGWALAARAACEGGVDLLVAHQAFHLAKVPGFTFRVGVQKDTLGEQHLPPGVRHILCGHIHKRQVTQVGPALVVQVGATERTSFSEREQLKGVAHWELGREITWRFQDLPTRPMRCVRQASDLPLVEPGDLVRLYDPTLQEAEVIQRGGLLWGRGRGGRSEQMSLLPRRRRARGRRRGRGRW